MDSNTRWTAVLVAAMVVGLAGPTPLATAARGSKVDRAIQDELAQGTLPVLRVIIRVRPGTLEAVQAQVQAMMRAAGMSSKVLAHPALDAITAARHPRRRSPSSRPTRTSSACRAMRWCAA